MDALTQPPASLEALRARKAALDRDLAQHDDLAARLDACMAARAQGNGRMDLPVDIGMGFTAEGVVSVVLPPPLPALPSPLRCVHAAFRRLRTGRALTVRQW